MGIEAGDGSVSHPNNDREGAPVVRRGVLSAVHRLALERSHLCAGISDDDLQEIARALHVVAVPAGGTICRQGEPGDEMYIVVRGRVRVTVERGSREFRLLDYLGPGAHFGEMTLLIERPRSATVAAVLDTELLVLERADFDALLATVPGFAANLSRALGFRLHWETNRQKRRHQRAAVGLVYSSPATERLHGLLASALADAERPVLALTDRTEPTPCGPHVTSEAMPREPGARSVSATRTAERVAGALAAQQRVLLGWSQSLDPADLAVRLSVCEEIWWLTPRADWEASRARLETLLAIAPHLQGRIHLVWFLRHREEPPPFLGGQLAIAPRDLRIVLAEDPAHADRHHRQSISMLVRHLDGMRVGLALGGGGARGMAHLGVLRALEREGIFFDLVAGTSSGALMGLSYAAGWAPQEALDEFVLMLTPPRLWRSLPWGPTWHLVTKFRTGAWDRMLRAYAGQATLEQMRVPLLTVAVDLVTGREIVRDRGDAIHAVLESINLPLVSRPILRDGMALVDGGILNNLPVDVLRDRGADLIVAVDVVSQLQHRFGGNTPHTPAKSMRQPGFLATYLRVNEVQDYGITTLRTHAADLVIMPDTAQFDWSDFSRARALADAGEAAAERALPQLKQMLVDAHAASR